MPSHFFMALLLALFVYTPDKTLRRYGGAEREWHLVALKGKTFDGRATIQFPRRNVITGQGPCNRFSSTNITPYPWFDAGPVAATRMACPALPDETAFFEALENATIAVIEGDTLTLSDEDTALLVFKARD